MTFNAWEPDMDADERMRYLCAAEVNAQQTVSRGETQYLHGDLSLDTAGAAARCRSPGDRRAALGPLRQGRVDSTMLTTDEMGSAGVPPATYTGFGELLQPDGQGGWTIGGLAPEGFPRYQYAGG